MSSTNRLNARHAFQRAFLETRGELLQAILKLRMEMIQFPKVVNTPPAELPRTCTAAHASYSAHTGLWLDSQREREACPLCKAATASYWARDAWKKGRGETIAKLHYRLDTYHRARRNYWAAGGHTDCFQRQRATI
jgi:hypothetical protein